MLNTLRNILIGPCPLCDCSAPLGQFCTDCQHNILAQEQHPYRCSSCLIALPQTMDCPNCHEHRLSLHRIYHLFDYVPPLEALILRFKNAKQTYLAHAFAHLFYLKWHEQLSHTHQCLIVPIPSSRSQLRKRNYNPAAIFAKAIAKKLQCQLDLTLLRRHESHALQKSLQRQHRFLNSSQLYYAHRGIPSSSIILVDDVLTTGSTLESAARALISAGAKQVEAFVIARSTNPF